MVVVSTACFVLSCVYENPEVFGNISEDDISSSVTHTFTIFSYLSPDLILISKHAHFFQSAILKKMLCQICAVNSAISFGFCTAIMSLKYHCISPHFLTLSPEVLAIQILF